MAQVGALQTLRIVVAVTIAMTIAAASGQPVGWDETATPTSDATPTGGSYMLTDVWGGAYSDTEKSPLTSDDDLMCWAAAAANVLDWTGWGHVDDGTGHVLNSADEIFGYFQDHWTDTGGMMSFAWDWWFDGVNDSQGATGWAQVDVPGGGFHPTSDFDSLFYRVNSKPDALWAVETFLRAGCGVTAAIYRPKPAGGLYGHAITFWGVNYDEADPDNYLGVWISDSDDDKHLDPAPSRLRYYEVSFGADRWYLQDYDSRDTWYIGSVEALNVPEPTTAILLSAGMIAVVRRRRRK